MNITLENLIYYNVDAAEPDAIWIAGYNELSNNSVFDSTFGDLANKTIYVGKEAFCDCSELTEIKIGANVKTIKAEAFKNCYNLTKAAFVNFFETNDTEADLLGFGIFKGCTSLSELTGISLFYNDVELPLGYYFGGHTYLDNINVVPDTLQNVSAISLSPYCFHDCLHISSILVATTVLTIPRGAFYNCTSLAWLGRLGEAAGYAKPGVLNITGFSQIEELAFYHCIGFNTLFIPAAFITFGLHVFNQCYNLVRIYNNAYNYSNGLKIIKGGTNYGDAGLYALLIINTTYSWASIESLENTLSVNVTIETDQGTQTESRVYLISVPKDAISFEIPATVTHINNYVGANHQTLEYIQIPKSVKVIGINAFSSCPKLLQVDFTVANPETETPGITTFEANAFRDCPNLKRLDYQGTIINWLSIKFNYPQAFFRNVETFKLKNNITFGASNTSLDLSDFTEVAIPANSFTAAQFIHTLILSSTTSAIEDFAFYDCKNLQNIYYSDNGIINDTPGFSENLTYIANNAFTNCDLNFTYSDGLKYLGSWIFGASGNDITECHIKSDHKYIVADAFKNCTELSTIYYDGTLNAWLDIVFNNIYSNPVYPVPGQLAKYPNFRREFKCLSDGNLVSSSQCSVTLAEIPSYSLSGMSLSEIVYNGDLSAIGTDALLNTRIRKVSCKASCIQVFNNNLLEELTVLNNGTSLNQIVSKALYNCSSLAVLNFIKLPDFIGTDAFFGCHNLRSIYINTDTTDKNTQVMNWLNIYFSNFYANPLCYNAGLYRYGTKVLINDIQELTYTKSVFPAFGLLNFKNLNKISIQSQITEVNATCFASCDALTSFEKLTEEEDALYKFTNNANQSGAIITTGTVANSDCTLIFATKNAATLENNIIEQEGVQIIASRAYYNSPIETINIPNTVRTIKIGAFEGCKKVTSIRLPFIGETNSATNNYLGFIFGAQTPVESGRYLPEQAYTLEVTGTDIYLLNNTFKGCTQLTSLVIGSTIAQFEQNCLDALISLHPSHKTIDNYTISGIADSSGNIVIATGFETAAEDLAISLNTIKYIYKNAFKNALGIKKITAPQVVTIGDEAFSGCVNLVDYNKGTLNSITAGYIGKKAFANCRSLGPIELTSDVEVILESAFDGCSDITSLKIDNEELEIKNSTFSGLTNVTEIIAPNKLLRYLPKAALETVTITTSGYIANNAFNNCITLRSVQLLGTAKITGIGKRAFYNCIYLQEFPWDNITESCSSIGPEAFYNCHSLYYLNIPTKIETSYETQNILTDAYKHKYIYTFTVPQTGHYQFLTNNLLVRFIQGASLDSRWYGSYEADFNEGDIIYVNLWLTVDSIDADHKLSVKITDPQDNIIEVSSVTLTRIDDNSTIILGASTHTSLDYTTITILPEDLRTKDNSIEPLAQRTTFTIAHENSGVGVNAFINCPKLVEIVDDRAISFEDDFIFGGAEKYCKYRRTSEDPTKLNSVGNFVFFTESAKTLLAYLGTATSVSLPAISGQPYSLSKSLFMNNDFITDVIVPESANLISVDSYAFYSCGKLESITFENASQMTLQTSAFELCPKLAQITFAVTPIMSTNVFSRCTALTTIDLGTPTENTVFDGNPFYYCNSLSNITIGANSTYSLISSADSFSILVQNLSSNNYKLIATTSTADTITSDILGLLNEMLQEDSHITVLGKNSLQNLKLDTFSINPTIISIEAGACMNTGLTQVNLEDSNSALIIGSKAFAGCNIDERIYIGTVSELGSYLFVNNSKTINSIVFKEYENTTDFQSHVTYADSWNCVSYDRSTKIPLSYKIL